MTRTSAPLRLVGNGSWVAVAVPGAKFVPNTDTSEPGLREAGVAKLAPFKTPPAWIVGVATRNTTSILLGLLVALLLSRASIWMVARWMPVGKPAGLTVTVTVEGATPEEGDTVAQEPPETLAVQPRAPLPVFPIWKVCAAGTRPGEAAYSSAVADTPNAAWNPWNRPRMFAVMRCKRESGKEGQELPHHAAKRSRPHAHQMVPVANTQAPLPAW